MTSKKLGALLRSVPPATAVAEPAAPMPSLSPTPVAAPVPTPAADVAPAIAPTAEPAARKAPRAAPIVEPEVPLQVLIPANIRKQLAFKAVEEGQSLRALVLRAIRSLGITVTDAEIEGKRGRRRA